MKATKFASLPAALIAVALAAAGCANTRDDSAMRTQAPMARVAAAPVVQQPDPVVAEAPAPVPMAAAPADPVVTAQAPTALAAPQNSSRPDNMMTERAPRADRN